MLDRILSAVSPLVKNMDEIIQNLRLNESIACFPAKQKSICIFETEEA